MAKIPNWLPVVGYEDYYEVSDTGLVRSLTRTHTTRNKYNVMIRTVKGAEKAVLKDAQGYAYVRLYKDGHGKTHRVSRLVLLSFVGEAFGREAMHLDHNRDNNSLLNFAWGTRQANEDDKTNSGRRPASTRGKFDEASVQAIRHRHSTGVPIKTLAQEFNSHLSNIWLIVKRKTWANV